MEDNALKEVLNWLEGEIVVLNKEINTRKKALDSLQNLVTGLKEYEIKTGFKDRYEKANEELEKEKERLVKLHNHYRTIEEECNTLKKKLNGWQEWFNSKQEIYNKLFSAPPNKLTEEDNKSVTEPKTDASKKKIKKKKKKKK